MSTQERGQKHEKSIKNNDDNNYITNNNKYNNI